MKKTVPYKTILASREKKILMAKDLRSKGYSYSQISKILKVSKMTASNYVKKYA